MTIQTILLVEDNPDDRELARLAFERSGIPLKMVIVESGVEALDYLFGRGVFANRDLKEIPALILLDLKLPGIDGLEVLRRLRAGDAAAQQIGDRIRTIPVAIMSTSREQQDLINSYNLGCNSYIDKPVDFGQFQTVARQLGLYWLKFNQVPSLV